MPIGQAQPSSPKQVSLSRSLIDIPIVFHIVYYDSDDYISDQVIFDQLKQLNDDFNGNNADLVGVPAVFKKLVGHPRFNFCLASMDPQGQSSTGIVRVQTDNPTIANLRDASGIRPIKSLLSGGSSAWNTEKYINVWIGNRDDGIIGDATFPTENESLEPQGIVLRYDVVGPNSLNPQYNLGRTLTHEMAHFFNVQHLWGSDASCNSDDDDIDDTPEQGEIYVGCETGEFISCRTKDMDTNFLNFRDDECLLFFTKGQADRMIDALFRFRYGLIAGQVCGQNVPLPPDPLKVATVLTNDFVTYVWINTLQNQSYTLSLFDLSGRRIWAQDHNADHLYKIEHEYLPTGLYILGMEWGGRRFALKLVLP